MYLTLLLLAFAVSIDSFGVGATYGLRNIRIPTKSVLIIALCSGAMMFISMNVGFGLAALLPVQVANAIGAVILVGIGMWALYSGQGHYRKHEHDKQKSEYAASQSEFTQQSVESKQVVKIEIKQLGLVIQILKKPFIADMDRSGTISMGEAFLLGIALSLDALGAGLGAAMIGLSMWVVPPVIAVMSAVFLLTGLRTGFRFRGQGWLNRLHYFPGLILILMGITRFWW